MKEKILKLRLEGKTYNQISKILGCAKSTICYHCGEGQVRKTNERAKKSFKNLNRILKRKKDNFSRINGSRNGVGNRVCLLFSSEEFKRKIGENPTCYLTGRKIDILQPKTYHCDHIFPVYKGGQSTLDNLGLLCRDANMAKGRLTIDEFLNLCSEVLTHNGYEVRKI
jgi:IS30 family transposase